MGRVWLGRDSGSREREGEDDVFGKRKGKSKGGKAEVGKQRPSSGNVSSLAGLHLRVAGEQAGMEMWSRMTEF